MAEATLGGDTAAFLRSLRAVRRYAPTAVPSEIIQEILEVGRWTGSAKNSQPWELVVVRDRDALRKLSTLGRYADHLAGAAFAIALVMASPGNQLDAGRLAERLMLAAWARGVGSCIGSVSSAENDVTAKALLEIPVERDLRTVIAFGYPADEHAVRVRTTPGVRSVLPSVGRRPLDEIAFVDRYGRAWTKGDAG